MNAVQPARADSPNQRRGLDQLVPRRREQPPVGTETERVTGAPDALQERRHAARRSNLAHQVDAADVDAELQRGRGHQRLEVAGLQPLLDALPALFGQAPVMAGHRLVAQPLGQVVGHPLRQGARVHEHQRRAVSGHQLGQAVVDFAPLLPRCHGLQVGGRRLDGQLQVALVPEVHDVAGPRRRIRIHARQEPGDFVDGSLRG